MPQHNQIMRIIELGVAQVNPNFRDMNLALAALAQENARARVAAGSVTDLTDSSTGTADANFVLDAVVTPTVVAQDGVTLLCPKAAFDTQIGLIEDAHHELGVKASEIIQLIAKGSRSVGVIATAAAADDTIAAITPLVTGSAAADQGVPAADGIAQIVKQRNIGSTIAAAISWLRVAQGLPPMTDGSGGEGYYTMNTVWGPLPSAAATGTAAAAGEDSLSETTAEAALTALVDNIATMAAALTEANGPAIGPFVVATHNPRTRFSAGDTLTAS